MLRNKGLTDKLLLLGVDGMDPRFTKRLVEEGKMPNFKKLMDMGSCREDLMMLGANPTITPPMWATLATGTYPMTHGIMDYNISAENDVDITLGAFSSKFLKAEPLWNVTAQAGKKTLCMHWPGGSFPPSIDSENLFTIDGSSPGACCAFSSQRAEDMVYIASTKAEQPSYMPYSVLNSELEGDETLELAFKLGSKAGTSPEAKARIKQYRQWYKEFINVEGYKPDASYVVDNVLYKEDKGLNWWLADMPQGGCISPIWPANGWSIDVPADAKEFVMITYYGKVVRNALILKNEQGVYDRVAIYKDKTAAEPMAVLEYDVFTGVYDTVPKKDGSEENIYRNMRLLKIAEDGSYVRLWSSRGMSCDDDSVWFPKSLFKEITENCGPLQPTSQMSGNDADLIMKCCDPQWRASAEWQSKVMHYMIEKYGVEVIFSHMHNVDLAGHNYMKYLKNRENSRYDENEVVKFAEATYKVTDDYIGSFMHLIDEGWTIMIFSDHALICAEEEPAVLCENCGVNVDPFREWGYTVMKVDENGNELPEVDWTKTRAIQTRSNSIYINVKGRDKHTIADGVVIDGIVDPADKYELEEEIITKLYGYTDEKTGKRVVALALHNKDAVLLGLGGPMGADIVLFVHETFVDDHGPALSTAYGYQDTSLSPIFLAAGPGIKENFRTTRYIREVDLAPTAAVMLGVDIPAECEGAPAYQIFTESM
ncbi:MAG: alkaline phosphatase family protein [Peptococcaceae bacterium]|nr:alkaline phosphatase family protein [Peptococcaceae bacterium]